jgi:hypothetical protein
MVISNAFNEPKLFVPKTNFFPVEIFPKFIQAKIVPIRTIIDETTNIMNNRQLIELEHLKNPPTLK